MAKTCEDCIVFQEFSGVKAEVKNLKHEDEEIWKGIVHERGRIDGMTNWVIAGMGAIIIQCCVFIGGLIMFYIKLKP
jgi:hypothetical protein